ncbi:MAG: Smr/MutS family protein [Rickettsiales bacterium]
MKPRAPTAEELAVWQQANRDTTRLKPGEPLPEIVEAPLAASAPATKTPSAKQAAPAAKKSLPPLTLLPPREAARAFKLHPVIHATLDLHGFSREAAYVAVQQFLADCQLRGARHVIVITGKGRAGDGVLRQNLPHWLNEPGLRVRVIAMARARAEKGGEGVLHVLVKKPHG